MKMIAKCQQLGLEYKVLSCQYDIDTESDLSLLLQDPRCPQHLKHSILDILENTNSLKPRRLECLLRELPENTNHIHIMGVGGMPWLHWLDYWLQRLSRHGF